MIVQKMTNVYHKMYQIIGVKIDFLLNQRLWALTKSNGPVKSTMVRT